MSTEFDVKTLRFKSRYIVRHNRIRYYYGKFEMTTKTIYCFTWNDNEKEIPKKKITKAPDSVKYCWLEKEQLSQLKLIRFNKKKAKVINVN